MAPGIIEPEPSAPGERNDLKLPPKSYAEAAEQDIPCSYADAVQLPPPPPADDETPPVKAKKKSPLPKKNGAVGLPALDIAKAEYTGRGMDDSPRSPSRNYKAMSPRRVSLEKAKKSKAKPAKEEEVTNGVVFEKYEAPDGDKLISVKPSDEYDQEPHQQTSQHKKGGLVSGRRAGAGWSTSR